MIYRASTWHPRTDPDVQALEKWGNWGQIAPGVSNGQSEIKFTKLEFARPETVAAQFDPDEGFTGELRISPFGETSCLCTLRTAPKTLNEQELHCSMHWNVA